MKNKEVDISFCAVGHINQTIKITKKGLTPKKLIEMLEAGEAFTTQAFVNEIGKDGEFYIIGEVINTDNNLEYDNFEIKEN